jgi:peptidyl-prolyl cis-trans isomerase C
MKRVRIFASVWIAYTLFQAACRESSELPSLESKRMIVAAVSGVPIYREQFEAELKQYVTRKSNADSLEGKTQRRVLLDHMIERRIILNEADRQNVVVGIEEVRGAFNRSKRDWLSLEQAEECTDCIFDEELRSRGLSGDDLTNQLRDELMIQKYFRNHVFSRIAITDEEIDTYIEAHPDVQHAPERVRALQILVKTKDEAFSVYKEIRRGLAFEDAAIRYSLSPESKNGGDLGYFSRGMMPKIFDEVCFELNNDEISKPVDSDYGFHIFKLIDKEPAHQRDPEIIRDRVERLIRQTKEYNAQKNTMAKLRREARIVIMEDSLAK